MRSYSVGFIGCCLLGCLAGCHGPHPNGSTPAMVSPPEPLGPPTVMTFALCSSGLPGSGMWKCDPAFADVNEDGFLDLAALPRLGDGPHIWAGNGKGEWLESSFRLERGAPSCGGGLDFGDVNGDGHLDLAVADHCQGVFVFLGDGAGHWETVSQSLYPHDLPPNAGKVAIYQGAEDVAVGDVNGDGFLDLVAAASDEGGINVYLGDGTGRTWTRTSDGLPSSGWAPRVLLADVNRDDALDVVASHSSGPRVWLSDGQGQWTPASTGLPSSIARGIYTGIAVGDVNEDGRVDIAVANWFDGPEVYLQNEVGIWHKTADVFPAMLGGAVGLDLGDIDRDGHLDMVVSGRLKVEEGFVRGMYALRGDGLGGWEHMKNCGLPETGLAGMAGVALGDVNGDGVLDVAAASGLIVETVPGPTRPALPFRMLVWCTWLPAPESAETDTRS